MKNIWWFVKDFKQFMAEVIANGNDEDRVNLDLKTLLLTLEKDGEKNGGGTYNEAHPCPPDCGGG